MSAKIFMQSAKHKSAKKNCRQILIFLNIIFQGK